ncbi:MAG: methylated-DNA--[protein]-cysteine S-methyltransferase [candidate division KSB1 bacterium]|nr:methylated-DNA--[protein]-cysteine S-methyltransferase [candidate division KSB1 bacterium]MDZ7274660.1 methylated-DNA--[protein]-cysteine S-methyltransferase [candidate division KSB1 bacterium]MDZ7285485.1 methylated-DNA--[protein]-cysteine S-methyltransferase [candidate division KSB1 bacterium]MDZ7298517.1 methylated-DNA--[protein]-cysteine S-methyltransferase [candidate division KSB1 bacterium]MDZ7306259.1 methylated-DNA--[protein]-cysteine S-methyltransferase [candidate division KSB1 bact
MQLVGHISEDVVMALYLGNLTAEDEQRLHRHVAECADCGREFALYREVLTGLEKLVQEMGGRQRAPLLRAAIKQTMRQRQIYYDLVPHPLTGPLWFASTAAGVCLAAFSEATPFEIEETLKAKQPEAWIIRDKKATAPIVAELRDYFQRRLTSFSAPIDWRFVPGGFTGRVLRLVSKIPYGQVYTYGEVAARLGNPRAVRAVGQALGANPIPIFIPCHRVVASDGKLGGFSAGTTIKRRLLELEGVRWPALTRQLDLFLPNENVKSTPFLGPDRCRTQRPRFRQAGAVAPRPVFFLVNPDLLQ